MTFDQFQVLVDQAIQSLPHEFKEALSNVDVVVEVWPSRDQLASARVKHGWLFGLYQGIPQTKRGHYHAVLPDKISVFAGPILTVYGTDPEIVKSQVRDTVLHEIGHHFGMSEDQIRAATKRDQ